MALIDKLTAIANAIRGKTGKEDKLTLEQMASEIENIHGEDTLTAFWEGRVADDFVIKATSIPPYAGYGSSVKNLIIENATTIGGFAFQLSSVENVVVNSNPTTMDGSTFSGCTSLKTFTCLQATLDGNTNMGGVFDGCTSLCKFEMPNIMKIGTRWFRNCPLIEMLDTHARYIDSNAFQNSGLETLIIRRDGIATLTNINAFEGTPIANGTGYIYVPKSLLSDEDASKDYHRATNWINFSEQFRAIEDFPEICGGAEHD